MRLIAVLLVMISSFPYFAHSTFQLRNITNTPTIAEENPAWSPDGTKIAFNVYSGTSNHIFVMPANGGLATQLTFGSSRDEMPAWSPDETKIAFYSNRSDNNEIWTVSYPNGQLTRITNGSDNSDWPTWSPDGQYIAFFKTDGLNYHLWKKNLITGIETQLTNSSRKDRSPDWSQDGQWLAYNTGPNDSTYWIYKIKPDGTNDTYVLNSGYFPVWSPDGTKIAFWKYVTGYPYVDSSDIFIFDCSTSMITNLTNDVYTDKRPCWSPDGKRIVFSSYRNGNMDLYIIEDVKESMKSLGEIKAMYAE